MPSVQNYIKKELVQELKNKLDTDLDIESISIQPFNIIQVNGIYINDKSGDTILNAKKVYADFDLLPLLNNELVISAARLSDFQVNLSKDSAKAPLNIQFIIDAFKPKSTTNKTKLDVKINTLNLLNGAFNFDIKGRAHKEDGKFDPNHISLTNINSKLALKSLDINSFNIQIKKLTLKEKSGFVLNNLITRVITKDKNLSVKDFELVLPKSHIIFEHCNIDLKDMSAFNELTQKAIFNLKIISSEVSFKDIAAFVPAFKNFQDQIIFKSEIAGPIDNLDVKYVILDYGKKMHLEANGLVKDVTDAKKLFLKGNLKQLNVNQEGIIGLLNNFSDSKKDSPKQLVNLGNIDFNGNIEGHLKSLKSIGHLKTELGAVNINLNMGFNVNETLQSFFKGKVSTSNFELGKLLSSKQLGNTSFDVNIDLKKPFKSKMGGLVHGDIHDFELNAYKYHDIKVDGKYDGLRLEGMLDVDDENGRLNLKGLFDLSKPMPELNFYARLKNIRLDNLNLSKKYKEAYLSLNIDANFKGKNIDDIEGFINIDSTSFLQSGKRFFMDSLRIYASNTNDGRLLDIRSNIINGTVKGLYSFTTIAQSVKKTLHPYLPALIDFVPDKRNKIKENNLTFDFTINNTENLSDVLKLPITIYSQSKIIGFYDNQAERYKLEGYFPSLNAGGSKLQSGYFLFDNTDNKINANITGTFVTKNNTQNNLAVNLTANNNIIESSTSFLNKDQTKLKGTLNNTITFSKQAKNILQTDVAINAGELVLNNSLWNIGQTNIKILPKVINIDNFIISNTNKDQKLTIDGTYSTKEDNKEKLLLTLKNIDLDYIFTTLNISALEFKGLASGDVAVSSVENNPYANVNLDVSDFGFNNTLLGKLHLKSELNPATKVVQLKGNITNANNKITDIDGEINPITQELSLYFNSEEVDIAFLNKYASSLFNDIKGTGTGNVHLFGNFSNVTVEGKAFISNGELGINFLNTRYHFSDTVYLKKDLIYFNDLKLYDQSNNVALLSGKVAHDYFSNFMYYVQLNGKDFMLYNATEKLNPIFYGSVYGTGYGTIKGDEESVDIDIRMKTQKGTYVHMNFMDDSATEYSFITYKQRESADSTKHELSQAEKIKAQTGMDVNMNLYIDATPDATVELLMDPVGGDKLKGTGSGAMQFIWGTNKDPLLYGTYQIHSGSYNFTFQKIMERKFTIQEGSYVQFRGDPFQALLDVTAKYRVVANLFDLDKNLVATSGQTSIPVNCILNLSGVLRHPQVKLDIELPSTDPEIARQIKNLISTEDMINRQVAYLLILSKFYTPNYAETDQRTNDFASLASATLSSQLGNILNKIDDRWQVGTNIRTSDSNFSSTEVELLLSSKLLNDRVLFNGNFGYRDNPLTQETFIGDVDIEILLNRMGTWRLKAYNHYNEKFYYINNNSVQTQGVGILYKKDFNNFKELFRKQKEKEIIIVKDTIKQDTVKDNKTDSIKQFSSFVKMKH